MSTGYTDIELYSVFTVFLDDFSGDISMVSISILPIGFSFTYSKTCKNVNIKTDLFE